MGMDCEGEAEKLIVFDGEFCCAGEFEVDILSYSARIQTGVGYCGWRARAMPDSSSQSRISRYVRYNAERGEIPSHNQPANLYGICFRVEIEW